MKTFLIALVMIFGVGIGAGQAAEKQNLVCQAEAFLQEGFAFWSPGFTPQSLNCSATRVVYMGQIGFAFREENVIILPHGCEPTRWGIPRSCRSFMRFEVAHLMGARKKDMPKRL